jgi:hypothetical protein
MATATRATVRDFNDKRTPATIVVVDDGHSTTTYTVHYDRPTTRPAEGPALVWDSFHEGDIRLETKNGEPLLRQEGPGLPSQCVLLVNLNQGMTGHGHPGRGAFPMAPAMGVVAGTEDGYLFFFCVREG